MNPLSEAWCPMLAGTSDGKVLVLEQLVTTGELQRSTGSTAVCAIQCTQDGQVAVADEGGLITVWKPNHMDKTMFGKKGWVDTRRGWWRVVVDWKGRSQRVDRWEGESGKE